MAEPVINVNEEKAKKKKKCTTKFTKRKKHTPPREVLLVFDHMFRTAEEKKTDEYIAAAAAEVEEDPFDISIGSCLDGDRDVAIFSKREDFEINESISEVMDHFSDFGLREAKEFVIDPCLEKVMENGPMKVKPRFVPAWIQKQLGEPGKEDEEFKNAPLLPKRMSIEVDVERGDQSVVVAKRGKETLNKRSNNVGRSKLDTSRVLKYCGIPKTGNHRGAASKDASIKPDVKLRSSSVEKKTTLRNSQQRNSPKSTQTAEIENIMEGRRVSPRNKKTISAEILKEIPCKLSRSSI